MTPFLDFKIGEMQNLKSKYFLGISKEFGISVVPEKLRFGLKTWIWALVGNAPKNNQTMEAEETEVEAEPSTTTLVLELESTLARQ